MPLRTYRAVLVGAVATCVVAVAVGGCGSGELAEGSPPSVVTSPVPVAEVARVDPARPRSGPAEPQLGVAYPFDLYSHCGVEFARFGGRWWRASPAGPEPRPRAAGDGTTAYTGYTAGTMSLVGTDAARFVIDLRYAEADEAVVTFFPTTEEPPPCG